MAQFTATHKAELKALADARIWLANEIRGGWTDGMLRMFERKFSKTGTAYGITFASEIDRFIRCRQESARRTLRV